MNYACQKAYDIDNIPYILCGREPRPAVADKANMYHALCPYQRFCGEKKCAVLLPEWEHCPKNAAENDQKAARRAEAVVTSADTSEKKSVQKRRK